MELNGRPSSPPRALKTSQPSGDGGAGYTRGMLAAATSLTLPSRLCPAARILS